MRVDVHTHVWPDRIAEVVLQSMVRDFGYDAIAASTVDAIKNHMRASGVDKSIVLGVTERADQVRGQRLAYQHPGRHAGPFWRDSSGLGRQARRD